MATVQVERVSKQFMLRRDRAESVGQLLVKMIPRRSKRTSSEPFWALRDVSCFVPEGRSLGIMGDNGSGKSTLLKILTRTMLPTEGRVRISGRVSALIELGAGFHPDFTGRENVVLNASILGISRREIEKRMEDVIEFSGLRPFIDTPVKYYSSGMHARLGFSVAIHVKPELLIVDEVLAVGDEAFQQKCMDRIFAMKREGVSILLVSHSLGTIEQLMDTAVWLDKGVLRAEGSPREVVHRYRSFMLGESGQAAATTAVPAPARDIRAEELRVLTSGHQTDAVASGSDITLEIVVSNDLSEERRVNASVAVRRPDGLEVIGFSSLQDGQPLALMPGRNVLRISVPAVHLASGAYEVDLHLLSDTGRRLGEWRALGSFTVKATSEGMGIFHLPHQWSTHQ